MAYDYNKLYGETPDALGEPNTIFVNFFDQFEGDQARVLDIGCGQGRDALFIARRGHKVVGVDISHNGIRDLLTNAKDEGLLVEGIVADVSTYTPNGEFDVVLIDRTLHMLDEPTRLRVLRTLMDHVGQNGWLLMADEAPNIAGFEGVIANHNARWKTVHKNRGYLFVQQL